MTDERLEKMGFSAESWSIFLKGIADEFGDGKLISHEWLKEQFGIKEILLKDYDSVKDFLKAIEIQQFAYLQIVQTLKWELLKQERMYIRNIPGDGYIIVRPSEQVQYGYNECMRDIRKSLREAGLVMSYVQQVDSAQQAKDNDIRAKYGMLKQMLSLVK